MSGVIDQIDKEGVSRQSVRGKGFGIKQHDEVMLEYGFAKKVQIEDDLTAGQYKLITLAVVEGASHHAEKRFAEAYGGIAEIWVIPNYDGSLPAGSVLEPIWNQKGPYLVPEADQLSSFRSWPATGTLPIDFDPALDANRSKWMDHKELYGAAGQGNQASSADAFSDVAGRYYLPATHVVLIKATESCHIHYQYSWHDFN